jgi:hypothetical protein
MIAAALFIFALAQSGGFFIALGNGWDEWSPQLVPSALQPPL